MLPSITMVEGGVEDAAVGVTLEIGADQGLIAVAQYPLQPAGSG